MCSDLSRRDFLKLGGALLLATAFAGGRWSSVLAGTSRLGRVAYRRVGAYGEPHTAATRLASLNQDSLVEILADVTGGQPGDANRTWHLLSDGGYVHSGGIQPVENQPNLLAPSLPARGAVGEISVPFSDAWWAVDRTPFRAARLYYASTHWVQSMFFEPRLERWWYKAYDHLYNAYYYIEPEAVRILPPGALLPLSANVPPQERSILVRLDEQTLYAFERGEVVFSCRISSGKGAFFTPGGDFVTFHKRPSAHMVGGESEAALYDLTGVPWNTYLTENGVAMHGTFWHNDYGTPHSHGCINLRPQDARFIYRWTLPAVPAGERYLYQPGEGTAVQVRTGPEHPRRWIT